MTLAEALSQVELEAGRTYDCVVNGKRVTVRVVPAGAIAPSARYDESDVMLDPWCELPSQGKVIPNAKVRWGELPVDIPVMPNEDE
ncbi:MAG: hypothetical protein L0211_05875 [Planctomycetaceae bacterium]|nr:hypothetical protein [Planctomycetaceae bacterium]